MKRRRGLSLFETALGLLIIAVITTFLYMTILRAYEYAHGVQERSIANVLLQSKLEAVAHMTYNDLQTGPGDFAPDFPDYVYNVTANSLQPEVMNVSVTVTSNYGNVGAKASQSEVGKVVTGQTLMNAVQINGIGAGTNYVVYTDPTVKGVSEMAASLTGPAHHLPNMPGGGQPAGVGADVNFVHVFVGDAGPNHNGIIEVLGAASGTPSAWGTYQAPAAPIPLGVVGGLSDDGTNIWVSDRTNHCIWEFTPSGAGGSWAGPFRAPAPGAQPASLLDFLLPPLAMTAPGGGSSGGSVSTGPAQPAGPNRPPASGNTQPGMGEPLGLAASSAPPGIVWMADVTNNCLRRFLVGGLSWDPNLYAPPMPYYMGIPRGIACDKTGAQVTAVDNCNIWIFNDPLGSMNWELTPYPNSVATACNTSSSSVPPAPTAVVMRPNGDAYIIQVDTSAVPTKYTLYDLNLNSPAGPTTWGSVVAQYSWF